MRGKVEDLPFLEAEHGLPTKVGAAAAGAAIERVDDDEIRLALGK